MEYSRVVVIGTELQYQRQEAASTIFVETAIIDKSLSNLPALTYYLKESAIWDSHMDKNNLVMLGSVAIICRERRLISLVDGTAISYKRLIVFSGPPHEYCAGRGMEQLSHGAFQTINYALRCHDICASITQPNEDVVPRKKTATVIHSSSSHALYSGNRLKDIEIVLPDSTPPLGLHSGSNRLYQVQT
jgi:hypothetical protein